MVSFTETSNQLFSLSIQEFFSFIFVGWNKTFLGGFIISIFVCHASIFSVCFSSGWWFTVCWRKVGGCMEVVQWAFVWIYNCVHNSGCVLGKGQRAKGVLFTVKMWVSVSQLTKTLCWLTDASRRVRVNLLCTQSRVLVTWVTTLSWKSSVYTLHCWVSHTL